MELEDAVNGMTRAASKEMSKTGAKALNRMKMTLKKNNPTYAAAIEAYRKDPDAVEKDENEVRREAKKAAHSSAKAAAAGGADDSDEDEVVIGRMGDPITIFLAENRNVESPRLDSYRVKVVSNYFFLLNRKEQEIVKVLAWDGNIADGDVLFRLIQQNASELL